jgi:hypothetical protein
MTMTTTNNNAATHELSIEDLDSVAGGTVTLKGFLHAVADGAAAGASVGLTVGGVNAVGAAAAGAAAGGAAGGIAYLARSL